jgi:2-polyprenyl-3-methyl-5-hydroxy-6-metoxy-1,4-benzoquinol methylase
MRDKREYWDKMAGISPERSVMDQSDRRSPKNKYIAYLREHAIVNAFKDVPPPAKILDFGCGTGRISRMLYR